MEDLKRLEIFLKMLKLSAKCGANTTVVLDSETSKYLYELIRKDIIENDTPINLECLQDETNENEK